MNLNKHLDFFEPADLKNSAVHVIGVGAMGSRIVDLLARLGVENINIYDFDTVEEYNITNQLYTSEDIGKEKVVALQTHIYKINPKAIKRIYDKGYDKQSLNGYVFLCVDSIELRKTIAENNKMNPNIKAMFDTRMRLTDAQSYGADWNKPEQVQAFLSSMDFSDTEAVEATPISACGTTLSVAPTVVMTAAVTVSNFMNIVKGKDIKQVILLDAFSFDINAF